MIIYPEIALKNGRCVSLRRGRMHSPIYHDADPIALARRFAAEGAEWLHVVDLDAVGRREKDNTEIVARMIRAVDVPVQVGGGIAKTTHADWWLANGASAVVVASAAVLNPGLIPELALRHPHAVVLSVDVCCGKVMVEGWTRPTEHAPLDFARRYDGLDLAGIVVTDIDYDIDLPDGSFALVTRMAAGLETPVIASGMVKSLDHLSTLRLLENVSGAIVGRALHGGDLTLEDAHRIAWGPGMPAPLRTRHVPAPTPDAIPGGHGPRRRRAAVTTAPLPAGLRVLPGERRERR